MSQLLETLDSDTHAPPKSRIGDGGAAGQLVQRLLQADMLRSQNRSKVKGIYDGNAPYNMAELKAKGLGNNCNINFRKAAAIINQFRVAYYDLVHQVPNIAEIFTNVGKPGEQADWNAIMSEEFDRMVTMWSKWDFIVQYHQLQLLLHGPGVCYFHDAIDWRPDVAAAGEVLVPDATRTNIDELEVVCILKHFSAGDMYNFIRDKKVARDLGWNVKAVEQAIIDGYTGQPPDGNVAFEWYQDKLKSSDIYYGSYEFDKVRVAHVLVREFDDKVSHHIVRADRTQGEFLFSKLSKFNSMEEVICPFFFDIGDGMWHSVRGLGTEVYPYCQIHNRLEGRKVDGAMRASTTLFQMKDGNSVNRAQLVTLTDMGVLPSGLDLIPNANLAQGLEATARVSSDMEQSMNQNIGVMSNAPGQPNPRQGSESRIIELQQRATLPAGNINRYYTTFDKLYRQMFARAASPDVRPYHPGGKQALEFQGRCVKRGVPIEALRDIDFVRASRSIGAGSAVNATAVTEAIIEIAGSFPEEGRNRAIRDRVARVAGTHAAERYMGALDTQRESTQDDSTAQLENSSMRTGGECVITIQQSHTIHLASHLDDVEGHYVEYENEFVPSGNPDLSALQRLVTHIDACLKHTSQHLQQLQNDTIRKADYEGFYRRFRRLEGLGQQKGQQLSSMLQAEQQKQPLQEILSKLDYKSLPESGKAAMEQLAGIPRGEGDMSVAERNLQLKQAQLQLKEAKMEIDKLRSKQELVHRDVETALKVKESNKPEKAS